MIELRDVSKRYETGGAEVHALCRVSLQIDPGGYVAFLGPSGSGKSTLLHTIGSLDRPSAGTYHLDGIDMGALDINRLADIRNRKVGFIFQGFHLMPRLSALENVSMPMAFAGVGASERQDRASMLLARVGLGDRMGHRPAELSGGQQQRVAIARALANHPSIVLADEPTGNLDSRSGQEIFTLLEELHGDGCTVLVVTHDEALANRARRIVRLLDGCLVS